jgi:hypothetical protein
VPDCAAIDPVYDELLPVSVKVELPSRVKSALPEDTPRKHIRLRLIYSKTAGGEIDVTSAKRANRNH